ncbi:MAG TPA: membrane-binding protein, partial [Deltaproteobacteria bacterium]|nr:membrane-binding protein [Deltaproteobacteria bacterium]
GEFKDGKFNGQGSFTFPEGGELEGHKYEGEWKDDKKNGQGTYFFPDGGKLVGEFRKDSPWNITDYDKNGKIKGKYVNGVRQ